MRYRGHRYAVTVTPSQTFLHSKHNELQYSSLLQKSTNNTTHIHITGNPGRKTSRREHTQVEQDRLSGITSHKLLQIQKQFRGGWGLIYLFQ